MDSNRGPALDRSLFSLCQLRLLGGCLVLAFGLWMLGGKGLMQSLNYKNGEITHAAKITSVTPEIKLSSKQSVDSTIYRQTVPQEASVYNANSYVIYRHK